MTVGADVPLLVREYVLLMRMTTCEAFQQQLLDGQRDRKQDIRL